jgi:hypothetical protein
MEHRFVTCNYTREQDNGQAGELICESRISLLTGQENLWIFCTGNDRIAIIAEFSGGFTCPGCP